MASTDFRLGEFIVQPGADRLMRGDLRVELEPKTMAVLLALAAQPGEVISSEKLIHIVWAGRPMGENPVYKAVAKLRRALDDEADEPRYIETIARKGYRLLVQPRPLAAIGAAEAPPSTPPPAEVPRSPRIGWRRALPGLGIGIVILSIVAGYIAFRAGTESNEDSRARTIVPRLYFPGLESDSTEVVAINAMIRDRLSGLPELTVSDRVVDAPLATLRLSGSALAVGDQLRVRVRLDGERSSDLWSSELLLPVAKSYRVADQIAAAVQEAVRLARNEKQLATLPFPAQQAYLQAITELRGRRSGFEQRMVEASAEVVRVAPAFARGHAIYAVACLFSTTERSEADVSAGIECARDAVARALALDPELAEAHAAAGLLAEVEGGACGERCSERNRFEAAQRSLEHAVRLDPSLLEARIWLGNAYATLGDLARAAEQREAALALDPLSPIANLYMNDALIARGELELVRERLLRLARAPGMPSYIYIQLAEVSLEMHRFDDAQAWARRIPAEAEDRLSLLVAAELLARSGRPSEARAFYARVSWDPWSVDDDIYFAVVLEQVLGGIPAVRDFIDAQLQHALAKETTGEQTDRKLRRIIGWSLTMADQPVRARPWLESVYGQAGPPKLEVRDIDAEVGGLEALAWVSEILGDTKRAHELAKSAIEILSTRAAAGLDNDSTYALAHALAVKLAGHRELAISELERAVDQGWAEPVFVRADPRWGDLRNDPALKALLARADQRSALVQIAESHDR